MTQQTRTSDPRWTGLRVNVALACMVAGLCGCAGDSSRVPFEACGMPPQYPTHWWEESGVRLRCEFFPDLCGQPVHSTVNEPDLERAIDIVFVGDGFTRTELPAYTSFVMRLVEGLAADETGFVATHPELFNYHRIDIVSATTETTNAAQEDTALGVCFERSDDMHGPEMWQPRANPRLVELAAENAPDADVVVVVVNAEAGGANASPSFIDDGVQVSQVRLTLWYSGDAAGVLTHELGHALFGLGDEYANMDECYPAPAFSTSDPLLSPNLSLDPEGGTWRHLVSGARPGGERYSRCIYHPTDRCRMSADSDSEPFCPVCRAHIEALLRVRAEPMWNDGPPRCWFNLDQAPDQVAGLLWVTMFAADPNGLAALELTLDGTPVAASPQMYLPSTCRFTGEWACTQVLPVDTLTIGPGLHELSLDCADRLGLESRATAWIDVKR